MEARNLPYQQARLHLVIPLCLVLVNSLHPMGETVYSYQPLCIISAVADPGFEWGPGAGTGLKCEHNKWCDREAITRGQSPRFSRGSGGMLPRKILKIDMLRYAFSALLGVFLRLNKGSKLLSWIVTKLKSPTVRYGWVGLFYVCENPPTFYEDHTGWAWLSPGEHRCVLIFSSSLSHLWRQKRQRRRGIPTPLKPV